MNKEKLDKKMAFLQTVAMPDQMVFTQCLKDYIKYRKTAVPSFEGCYGFLVDRQKKGLVELSTKELIERRARLKEKLDTINNGKKETAKMSNEFTFNHIWIGDSPEHTDCRLYLRIMPSNVYDIVDKIIDECLKREISLYFKFTLAARNDSFVFYTDYDHVQALVDLIEEVYQKNPDLFIGADELPPLCGKVRGFIGFMEEPQKEVSIKKEGANFAQTLDKSANTYRTRLLDSIADFYEQKGIQPQFLTIKNIQQFSLPLDISPRFSPLNNSSVEELEKAGYNIGLIGTNATDIFSTINNETAGLS